MASLLTTSVFFLTISQFMTVIQSTPISQDPTTITSPCAKNYDVVVLIDASGSICDNDPTFNIIPTPIGVPKRATCTNWENIIDFVREFAAELDIGRDAVRMSVIRFGNYATLLWNLTTHLTNEDLDNAIASNISYPALGQNTNTQAALTLALNELLTENSRNDIPNLVLLISDGQSTINRTNTLPAAQLLKEDGQTTIVAVGMTDQINITELCGIATKSQHQTCFIQPTYNTLQNIPLNLVCKAASI